MKKAPPTRAKRQREGEPLPEYAFDAQRTRPNRFAAAMRREVVTVVLDADVAAVFPTAEEVNRALRSLIAALPDGVRDAAERYRQRPRTKRA
jgi:hypothetical protein